MLNTRDQIESDRLDFQHKVLADFMGYELLHPSIDVKGKDSLNVADVGTGTGIWLKKLLSVLQSEGRSSRLIGFDISSDQFPSDTGDIRFSTHDATQPFPAEHWTSYDVVHVRLFVFALREPDLRRVMENVVQLLRPGGYLQWEDADFCYTAANQPASRLSEMISMVTDYSIQAGFSMQVSKSIMDQGHRLGLVPLTQYDYSSLAKPDFYAEVKVWFTQLLQVLVPVTLIRSGRAADDAVAEKLSHKMLYDLHVEYAQGVVPRLRIIAIVGRKPLLSV